MAEISPINPSSILDTTLCLYVKLICEKLYKFVTDSCSNEIDGLHRLTCLVELSKVWEKGEEAKVVKEGIDDLNEDVINNKKTNLSKTNFVQPDIAVCFDCGKSYKTNNKSVSRTPYTCNHCKTSFPSCFVLMRHLLDHNNLASYSSERPVKTIKLQQFNSNAITSNVNKNNNSFGCGQLDNNNKNRTGRLSNDGNSDGINKRSTSNLVATSSIGNKESLTKKRNTENDSHLRNNSNDNTNNNRRGSKKVSSEEDNSGSNELVRFNYTSGNRNQDDLKQYGSDEGEECYENEFNFENGDGYEEIEEMQNLPDDNNNNDSNYSMHHNNNNKKKKVNHSYSINDNINNCNDSDDYDQPNKKKGYINYINMNNNFNQDNDENDDDSDEEYKPRREGKVGGGSGGREKKRGKKKDRKLFGEQRGLVTSTGIFKQDKINLDCSNLKKEPTSCAICFKVFLSQIELDEHEKTHYMYPSINKIQVQNIYADKCISQMKSQFTKQTGAYSYACPECGIHLKSELNLRKHIVRNHSKDTFLCNDCGRTFNKECELNTHVQMHINPDQHQCKICSYSFKNKHHLKRHMMRHSTVRPHKCINCGQGFVRQDELRNHMFTHYKKELIVTCDICHKKFSNQRALDRHAVNHKVEKMHICKTCDKGFNRIDNLRSHMALHTNHQCQFCPQMHNNRRSLEDHLKASHSAKYHQIMQAFPLSTAKRKLSLTGEQLRANLKKIGFVLKDDDEFTISNINITPDRTYPSSCGNIINTCDKMDNEEEIISNDNIGDINTNINVANNEISAISYNAHQRNNLFININDEDTIDNNITNNNSNENISNINEDYIFENATVSRHNNMDHLGGVSNNLNLVERNNDNSIEDKQFDVNNMVLEVTTESYMVSNITV